MRGDIPRRRSSWGHLMASPARNTFDGGAPIIVSIEQPNAPPIRTGIPTRSIWPWLESLAPCPRLRHLTCGIHHSFADSTDQFVQCVRGLARSRGNCELTILNSSNRCSQWPIRPTDYSRARRTSSPLVARGITPRAAPSAPPGRPPAAPLPRGEIHGASRVVAGWRARRRRVRRVPYGGGRIVIAWRRSLLVLVATYCTLDGLASASVYRMYLR